MADREGSDLSFLMNTQQELVWCQNVLRRSHVFVTNKHDFQKNALLYI